VAWAAAEIDHPARRRRLYPRQQVERRQGAGIRKAQVMSRIPFVRHRSSRILLAAVVTNLSPQHGIGGHVMPGFAPTSPQSLRPSMIDLYAMGSPNVVKIYVALEEITGTLALGLSLRNSAV